MTKDEALKLALEALHGFIPYLPLNDEAQCGRYDKAITAIKEALAQPEQKPVVWMYQNKSTHEVRFQKHMRSFVDHGAWYEVPLYSEPLANQEKTSGSPIKEALANDATNDTSQERVDKTSEIVHEPVAWLYWQSCLNDDGTQTAPWVHRLSKFKPSESIINKDITPLYTTPPQRKPLTDEEIRRANHHMVEGAYDYSFKQGVKWAEYKHGIKGEA